MAEAQHSELGNSEVVEVAIKGKMTTFIVNGPIKYDDFP